MEDEYNCGYDDGYSDGEIHGEIKTLEWIKKIVKIKGISKSDILRLVNERLKGDKD